MSEIDNKIQDQKPKMSKLAIASLVVPVILWCSGWFLAAIGAILPKIFSYKFLLQIFDTFLFWFFFLLTQLILLSSPIGIALAISSLIFIGKSKGKIGGKRFAIEGILISVILFILNWLLWKIYLPFLNLR